MHVHSPLTYEIGAILSCSLVPLLLHGIGATPSCSLVLSLLHEIGAIPSCSLEFLLPCDRSNSKLLDQATPNHKTTSMPRTRRAGRKYQLKKLVKQYSDPSGPEYHYGVSTDKETQQPRIISNAPLATKIIIVRPNYNLHRVEYHKDLPPLGGIDPNDPRFEAYRDLHVNNGTYNREAKIN